MLYVQTVKTKPSYTVGLLFAEVDFTPSANRYLDYVWERQANKWGFHHKQERGAER